MGHDVKASCECCKGKRGRLPGVADGKLILWNRAAILGSVGEDVCVHVGDSVSFGVTATSGEYFVASPTGVAKTRTTLGKPLEE